MKSFNSNDRSDAERVATVPALLPAVAVLSALWIPACQAAGSKDTYENELSREYKMESAIERWQLERNPVAAPMIPARKITESNEPVPGIPACGFSRPVFWTAAQGIVVDRSLFTDLRSVPARQARDLGPEGTVVGSVRDPRHDPRQVVKILVTSGVIDANIHVMATVCLMEEGRDSRGYWARLVSDDRFWTNRENRVLYDFAVGVSPEGEVRLMNANHVGE